MNGVNYNKEIALDSSVTNENVMEVIQSMINSNRLMIFIKGTPSMPMCGFSARVVEILERIDADYRAFNVLDNPLIRENIKKYSNWPTIPQVYFNSEFLGGCDIITDMYSGGELAEMIRK